MTLIEIITIALRLRGVIGDGMRAPSAEQAQDGVTAFNNMWKAMRGREIGQRLHRKWDASAGDTAVAGGLYSVAVYTPLEPKNGDRFGVVSAVTVTATAGTIEGAASHAASAGDSWFYREDTGNWVLETDLAQADEQPFSDELDEALPAVLAVKLVQYAIPIEADLLAMAQEGRGRIRQLYGSRPRVATENPLLRGMAQRQNWVRDQTV